MYLAYCRNIFIGNGQEVRWHGEVARGAGRKTAADALTASAAVLRKGLRVKLEESKLRGSQ